MQGKKKDVPWDDYRGMWLFFKKPCAPENQPPTNTGTGAAPLKQHIFFDKKKRQGETAWPNRY
jgi:hypothetical protein